ncbi:GNAT family protein [Aureisphaera galaxeae]|uniref:GNAT family N-acetyltransferase n=1 Tax=Aureisphaera galaxeae TaxID=1538023 RepID=UPI002350BED3|nr:GNAT family protein [Aureisphaera galaxeae]MDC8003817.1 GNAT family protein [Aureisphaera galaxeae]
MIFDTTQTYTLENDRVLLRPLGTDDIALLLPFSTQEPELWNYSLVSGSGEENFRSYMDFAFEKWKMGDSYPFIVFDKKTQRYAGSTRFYDIQPYHKTLQLGYTWYGKEFQGTGLNKHCKYLMLEFAFETLNAERVEFRADANNARSIAAMKSIGCTVEGILRNNCTAPEGRRSSIVLSILKEEWYNNIKQELQNKLT